MQKAGLAKKAKILRKKNNKNRFFLKRPVFPWFFSNLVFFKFCLRSMIILVLLNL